MSQISFDFPFQDKYITEDFFVAEENSAAFNFISNYDFNTVSALPKIFAVHGSNYSGKTHLAHIWQRKSQGIFLDIAQLTDTDLADYIKPNQSYIIEDINKITGKNQITLFHLFNIIQEKEAYLLITSPISLNKINYNFLDLASRFKNIFTVNIKEPDSNLIKILLIKNFSARQLEVEKQVVNYLAKNIDRYFAAIYNITKMLEFYCFEKKRKITIPLVNEVLKKIELSNYKNF